MQKNDQVSFVQDSAACAKVLWLVSETLSVILMPYDKWNGQWQCTRANVECFKSCRKVEAN